MAHKSAFFIPFPLIKGIPRRPGKRSPGDGTRSPRILFPAVHGFFLRSHTSFYDKSPIHCFFGKYGASKQHCFAHGMRHSKLTAKTIDQLARLCWSSDSPGFGNEQLRTSARQQRRGRPVPYCSILKGNPSLSTRRKGVEKGALVRGRMTQRLPDFLPPTTAGFR